jgi:hypothetical protein
MPSPFPGMDPFLESPVWYGGFHNKLITHLEEALQPILPAPYYANSGERVWLEVARRYIEPDVNVIRSRPDTSRGTPDNKEGGVAVAESPASAAVLVKVTQEERREPYLEIYVREGDERRLVTLVEVLSPANKTSGADGMVQYLRKRREVLQSQAHLVEIDLLRGGQHVTAVPRDLAVEDCGPFDYHVCVHQFDRRNEYCVYPFLLHTPLPTIRVPLLPGDPDVSLDLQQVFTRCYDAGPYSREIDYAADPIVPPLRKDQAQRVEAILVRLGR